MQSFKLTTRLPIIYKSASILPHQHQNKMSTFFPRDIAPFFRILDDLATPDVAGQRVAQTQRAYQPKFNVREEKESFKLQGELPGVAQKDITIEFVDPNTLVVRGRREHEREFSNQVDEGKLLEHAPDAHHSEKAGYHTPSVEDEKAEENNGSTATVQTPKTQSSELTTGNGHSSKSHPQQPHFKYWLHEHSVGEFHRSFSFPGQVNQDAVKAKLKDGILSIVVPKKGREPNKKINID